MLIQAVCSIKAIMAGVANTSRSPLPWALAQFSYRNQIKTVQQVLEAVMEQIAVQSV